MRQRSVGGTSSTTTSQVEPGQALQLLAHHGRLQAALRGEVDVLEVAAAAGARARRTGTAPAPGRATAVSTDDGVAAPEAVALAALGDLHDDPLPGQGVPDEDDAVASGLVGGDAGHAVAAVGDRADLDLVARPDPGGSAGRPLPRTP